MKKHNDKTLLICSLATGLLLSGCQFNLNDDSGSNTETTGRPTPETRLVPSSASGGLERYIKDGLTYTTTRTGNMGTDGEVFESFSGSAAATTDASVEAPSSNFSGTNLQVSGADESDRIKSDGHYLYSIKLRNYYDSSYGIAEPAVMITASDDSSSSNEGQSNPGIMIHQIQSDPAGSSLIGEIELDASIHYINGLYLTTDEHENGKQLIAVTNGTDGSYNWYDPWAWQAGQTQVQLYDVSQPNTPNLSHQLQLDGFLIDSRRIDNTLYLVTRFTPSYEETTNLAQLPLAELLPTITVDDSVATPMVSESTCFLPEGATQTNSWPVLTTITAINLDAPQQTPVSVCYGGHADNLFATPQNIYLTATGYREVLYEGSSSVTTDNGIVADTALASSYIPYTSVHKFALTDNGPTYRGTGVVPGSLMTNGTSPSFLLGENNEVLHILTSWWDENGLHHQLNNLQENSDETTLEIVATLPNSAQPTPIGKPGEFIYAVRYIGERAYVVTYQKTDPLYVLDLSDAEQPTIAGELEMPGYSSYLHAVNDELLLGIGKETVIDSSGNFAWYQGLKISLFNVADIDNPQEIKVLTIGERGTYTPLLDNHHALSYLHGHNGEPDRFTLPIQHHEGGTSTYASAYSAWQYSGLFLFEIDEGSTPDLRHQGTLVSANSDSDYYPPYLGSDRAIIQDSAVHYLHQDDLTSADWDAVTP